MLTSVSSFSRLLRGFGAFKNDAAFKEQCADTLYSLGDYFSAKYDKKGDDFNLDVTDDYLSMGYNGHQFLVSRQMPGHQIWISSPRSGSLKFDWDSDLKNWFDHKESSLDIKTCLDTETNLVFGE